MGNLEFVCVVLSLFVGAVLSHLTFDVVKMNWHKVKRGCAWVLCVCGILFVIVSPMIYEYIRVCTDWFNFGWTASSQEERYHNVSLSFSFFLFTVTALLCSIVSVCYLCNPARKDK